MIRTALAGALSIFCAWATLPAAAQSGNPLEGDPNAIGAGRGIYAARCATCHGADAKGATGPDLTSLWATGKSDDHVFTSVRDGIEGSVMPPGLAAGDEIWAIVAYLRDISTVPPFDTDGDAAAGRALFDENCARCHRVNGEGGTLGPDLSRIATVRSREALVRAVREPAASVAEGYRRVTLVTREGERIEGAVKAEDAFSIQVVDTDERLQGYRKADFAEIVHENASLMPGFGRVKLSEHKLEDLLAFLATLRGPGR